MDKWWQRSNPEEIQPFPWISPKAIEFLESILKPDFEVVEHGSGGSTLWLADRVKKVNAFENNDAWRKKIEAFGKDNIYVYYPDINFTVQDNLFSMNFDLLFIDGEPVEDRRYWIKNAPSIVKHGGWVVLDNANRPEYADMRQWLAHQSEEVVTIDGNEAGTKYLVTEFYR